MSLEDKFYPPNRDRLTTFDNYMIQSAGKLVQNYQNFTGDTHESFVKQCFAVSGIASVATGIYFNPGVFIMGFFSLARYVFPDIKSPLEEEMELESKGQPRHANKLGRLGYLAFGSAMGVIWPIAPLIENYNSPDPEHLLLSVVFGMYALGSYASKAYIPPPLPESIPKKVLDKLKFLEDNLDPDLKPA